MVKIVKNRNTDHEENESNGGKTKKNGRKKRVAIKWQE